MRPNWIRLIWATILLCAAMTGISTGSASAEDDGGIPVPGGRFYSYNAEWEGTARWQFKSFGEAVWTSRMCDTNTSTYLDQYTLTMTQPVPPGPDVFFQQAAYDWEYHSSETTDTYYSPCPEAEHCFSWEDTDSSLTGRQDGYMSVVTKSSTVATVSMHGPNAPATITRDDTCYPGAQTTDTEVSIQVVDDSLELDVPMTFDPETGFSVTGSDEYEYHRTEGVKGELGYDKYDERVTLTMEMSCDVECVEDATVPDEPVYGHVSFDWSSGTQPGTRTVQFDPSGSELPDGGRIEWDFGDGTTATRTVTGAFSHTYPSHGEYQAVATLSCDRCVSDEESYRIVVDPVTTYSPQVRLYPGEDFKPARPGWFAKHSNLKWNLTDCRDKTIDKTPSLAKLGGNGAKPYTARQHYRLCKFETGKTYNSTQLTRPFTAEGKPDGLGLAPGFYLTLDDKSRIRKGEGTNIPMTYSMKRGEYITYWLFYAYDPKVGVGGKILSHEGDWERVIVLLDDYNRADQVGYFQHTCDAEMYGWDEMADNGYLADGSHPVVYSSRGSHASYPIAETFEGGVCEEKTGWKAALEGKGDETKEGGRYWEPWKTGFENAKDQPWYGFGGAWGEVTGPGITGNLMKDGSTGPLGPPHKDPGTLKFT